MKFSELLKLAQFHGAPRVADQRFRWLWVTIMIILLVCSVAVIHVTINRFIKQPTFLMYEQSYDLNMAFPSIHVCPEVNYSQEKIDKFIAKMEIPPGYNVSYYKRVIQQMAAFYSYDTEYKLEHLENIERLLEYNGLNVEAATKRLITTCEETLFRCSWKNRLVNCSSLFRMELTGAGYCCVFNGQSLKPNIMPKAKWFSNMHGFSSGLMLVVNQTQELHSIDLSYKWIALQSSQHFVETIANGTPLSVGTEHWAAYYYRAFKIKYKAKSLSPNVRNCRLTTEALSYFPMYHRDYCILECQMMKTLTKCHCVRAAFPRPYGTRTCKARSLDCARHTMVSLHARECDCPEACDVPKDFTKYSSLILHQSVKSIDSFYDDLDFSKVTIVRAFIQNRQTKVHSRWPLFGPLDLFAQLGGTFNVFFGFSILTVLELIHLGYHGLLSLISYRNSNKTQQIMPSQ